MTRVRWSLVLVVLVALAILAACGAPATSPSATHRAETAAPSASTEAATAAPTAEVQPTQVFEASPTQPSAPTQTPEAAAETATEAPTAQVGPTSTQVFETTAPLPTIQVTETRPIETVIAPTATAITEVRLVELEWPPTMRLGESDLVRLALIPSKDGYVVTTEFPDHRVATQTVPVPRPGGYDLSAVARLDGVGFDLAPSGEQAQGLPLDQPVTWRWTLTPRAAGQQRLSLSLKLVWTPQLNNPAPKRETVLYAKGLNVQVSAFLGLTLRQASMTGMFGMMFGASLGVPLFVYALRPRRLRAIIRSAAPNRDLIIEHPASVQLSNEERTLLQTLFGRYQRVMLEGEFRSGYSGARTFLVLPMRPDGRADAYTIAKMGERDSIEREYANYEEYVKDTLPPITARIQELPVTSAGDLSERPQSQGGRRSRGSQAALRYTFIGEAGKTPLSLREALLADPDPAWLEKLFATFGPNWWMQRKPYTFRLGQEYDRMLPAHYVLEPVSGLRATALLDGRTEPGAVKPEVGQVVTVRGLRVVERRVDGRSLSLIGESVAGYPALRVRWASLTPPAARGVTAKIVATRETLLRETVAGFELHGMPDPLSKLAPLLNTRVPGTQSTIHGDLNVENILVGPGGFLWLIDFAQTREGHTLYDFAHLEAEVIAHVIAPRLASPTDLLSQLESGRDMSHSNLHPLLAALQSIAGRCLFNPGQAQEYQLALCLACLGALKYPNLSAHQKHTLFLVAASIAQSL